MRSFWVRYVAFAGLLAGVSAMRYPLVQPLQNMLSFTPITSDRVNAFKTLMTQLYLTHYNSTMYTNSTVRDILLSNDLTDLSFTAVSDMDESVWTFVGAARVLTLGRSSVNYLLTAGKLARVGLMETVEAFYAANVTVPEAIAKISTALNKPITRFILIERLGDPTTWTSSNITSMKDILFYLPLEKITNIRCNMALDKLNYQVQLCVNDSNSNESKSASCPSVAEATGQLSTSRSRYFITICAWLTTMKYGPPNQWSNATLAALNVSTLLYTQLLFVQPTVLVSRASDVIQMLQADTRKRIHVGRTIVKNLLLGRNVKAMTSDSNVLAVLNGMGPVLTNYVRKSDLPDVALSNYNVADMMKTAELTAVMNGSLGASTIVRYTYYFALNKDLFAYQARDIGVQMLSLASPTTMLSIVNGLSPSRDEMSLIIRGLVGSGGVSTRVKLMLLKDKIISLAGGSGNVNVSLIPPLMYDLLDWRTFQNMSNSSAAAVLAHIDVLTWAQIEICLSKLNKSDVLGLPPGARSALSVRRVIWATGTRDDVRNMSRDMPATSVLAQAAAYNTWWYGPDYEDLLYIDLGSPVFQFYGASEARKMLPTRLWQNLEYIQDKVLTREACLVMKNMLVNVSRNTQGTTSEAEAFSLLTLGDMMRLPVCVIAAFSPDLIAGLDNRYKTLLLEHLIMMGDMVYRSTGITPSSAKLIYELGFRAANKPLVLTYGDVDKLQTQLPLAPAVYLSAMQSDATPDALRILNRLAMTPLMPCLDSDRRGAIGNMIINYLGNDPRQWEDLNPVCCLLYTLPLGMIKSAPGAAVATCNCHVTNLTLLRSMEYTKQVTCAMELGTDYIDELKAQDAVTEAQGLAYLKLVDPRTYGIANPPSRDFPFCAEASIFGADHISYADLDNITAAWSVDCLPVLGSNPMQQRTASVLAGGVSQTLSLQSFSYLSMRNMTDMGYTFNGINMTDIASVPRLAYPDLNYAVMSLGAPDMGFTSDQLYAWAAQVLNDWKSPVSSWTAADMLVFNGLFCGVSGSVVGQLNGTNFMDAVPMLTITLENCITTNTTTITNITAFLAPFALKAVAAYGPTNTWTKHKIRELGIIAAGLSPADLKDIPPEAMAGLTPEAVAALQSSAIQVLSPSQIVNMDMMTALSVSPTQQSVLNASMMDALMQAQLVQGQGNGGVAWRGPSMLTTLLLLLPSTLPFSV